MDSFINRLNLDSDLRITDIYSKAIFSVLYNIKQPNLTLRFTNFKMLFQTVVTVMDFVLFA